MTQEENYELEMDLEQCIITLLNKIMDENSLANHEQAFGYLKATYDRWTKYLDSF